MGNAPIHLGRFNCLLLIQQHMLLIFHRAESRSYLLHQVIPFVGQVTLAESSKQVFVTQFHQVPHNLKMPGNHRFNS